MKKNILAVGVNKDIISGITKELDSERLELNSVTSVHEALSFIKRHEIIIVILNNLLPDVGDYREFCILIRSQARISGIPIILLGENKEEISAKISVLKSGLVSDYIILPAEVEEIVARMNVFIEVRMLHEELELKNILLSKISITDELTKLHNRRYLLERLAEEIERCKRYNFSISCLLIDLDHFKRVNDKFGHQAGDEVLIELSRMLKSNIRVVDILGRYGGEEFLVILPHTNLEQLGVVAERLRDKTMSYTFLESKHQLKLTLSIGGTAFSALDKPEINKIIQIIDEQLYSAKNQGRNRVRAVAYPAVK